MNNTHAHFNNNYELISPLRLLWSFGYFILGLIISYPIDFLIFCILDFIFHSCLQQNEKKKPYTSKDEDKEFIPIRKSIERIRFYTNGITYNRILFFAELNSWIFVALSMFASIEIITTNLMTLITPIAVVVSLIVYIPSINDAICCFFARWIIMINDRFRIGSIISIYMPNHSMTVDYIVKNIDYASTLLEKHSLMEHHSENIIKTPNPIEISAFINKSPPSNRNIPNQSVYDGTELLRRFISVANYRLIHNDEFTEIKFQ